MRKAFLAAAMTLVLLLSSVSVFAAPADKTDGKNVQPKTTVKLTQTVPDKAETEKVAEEKPASEPVVKYGDRGDEVLRVQKMLADSGFYAGEFDGIFGGGTLQSVQDFQAVNGLPTDGTVGRTTLAYMERAGSEPSRYSRSLIMSASAYTRFDDGCGEYTSRGHLLRKGLVAVDPHVIPLGTRLYIPGYGFAIADDTGGAIKGNRIDLSFESRGEAFQFGRQRVTVYILD
ncbi:MAG: 3D domain-containing protein [Negativicutes bacterium]|nr:3D domain-containing protein [Negativicutes bacterium]